MIIQKQSHEVLCISQIEHAKLASAILKNLNMYQKLPSTQKSALHTATLYHDHGWHDYDTNPIYPKNSIIPLDFTQISSTQHIDIWTKTKLIVKKKSTLIQYLICTHNSYLANIRHSNTISIKTKKKLTTFLTTQKQLQSNLKQSLIPLYSITTLNKLSNLLKLADWISLTICLNQNITYINFDTKINIDNYPEIKCSPPLNNSPHTFSIHATKLNLKQNTKEKTKITLTFN